MSLCARDLIRLTLALLIWTALAAALLLRAQPVPDAAAWAAQVQPTVSAADYLRAVDQARAGWLRYGLELAPGSRPRSLRSRGAWRARRAGADPPSAVRGRGW